METALPAHVTDRPHSGEVTVELGPMVHGGYCVARHQGRVVYVRHGIPGETVVAQLIESDPAAQYWLADTVWVVEASEYRRSHQWKLADSLRSYLAGRQPIDGLEFGHIVASQQRRLKALAFRDQMVRIGGQRAEDMEISVQGMENDERVGLNWRTRTSLAVSAAGRVCMPVHRGLDVVPVRNVPPAVPQLDELHLWRIDFSGAARVDVITPGHGGEALLCIVPTDQVAASRKDLSHVMQTWRHHLEGMPQHVSVVAVAPPKQDGDPVQLVELRGRSWVRQTVVSERFGAQEFRVSGDGFWQPHRDGPSALVEAVLRAADVQPGQVVADLHAGAGLFSRFLAEAVGPDGTVLSVPGTMGSTDDARVNLGGIPQATVFAGAVTGVLGSWLDHPEADLDREGLGGRHVETVVLYPPRDRDGHDEVIGIHLLAPDRIVYVAKDPAAFARDTRWLTDRGWSLDGVEVFDLAPDTHHMESVAVFTRR